MNVPNYVKPIIGYRMWGLASFLMSVGVCGEMWYPGQPMTARCKVSYPKVSKARFALAGAMRIARGMFDGDLIYSGAITNLRTYVALAASTR